MKEDHIIWSNGCVKIKEINKCGPYDYWSNSHAQKKKKMKEDYIISSNGRVQIKEIN